MADSITSAMTSEGANGPSGLPAELFDPIEAAALRSRVLSRVFGSGPRSVQVGRYHVLEPIGRGAMGSVYAAYDENLDRKVALKILHTSATDAEARERLLREAKALGRLSHPNVVQVHDAGEWNDQVFVAMEFVDGCTLRAWLDEAPRHAAEILARFREAGEGLAAAHEAGVVHRDFKPENVLVGAEDGRVRVADFGLAFATLEETREAIASISTQRLDERVLTRTGLVLGTPAYMAPEQLHGGRVDPRTDQFAFAVALHEALFGRRPFRGETLQALDESIAAGPALPSSSGGVPPPVRAALARALAYAPEERFGSMRELLRELAAQPHRGWRRAALTIGVAAAVVVGALAVGPSPSRTTELERNVLAARLAAAERVHGRERDAARLEDATKLAETDPTAAAAALARIGPNGWSPAATELLGVARARGVAARILRFEHAMRPLDARAGWIRVEEPVDPAQSRGAWQAVSLDAATNTVVAAPRSGIWSDVGGAVVSYYEHARGLQVWPVDGSGVRSLSGDGDHHDVFLAVDPRGEHAALYRDDVVTVYDLGSGEAQRYERHPSLDVATAALAPGGAEIAAASEDGRLVVHDLASGEQTTVTDRIAGLVRFSADGRWLGGLHADGRLALIDRETGTAIETPTDTISTFAFSPAQQRLVTCASAEARSVPLAKVWSLPSFVELATLPGEPGGPCQIDVSADGDVVVVATPGRDATVVDLRSGWSFAPRGGPRLETATVSADGTTLTTLHDSEARVWSLADLRAAVPLPPTLWRREVAYAGSRKLIVRSHDHSVDLLDRQTGTTTPFVDLHPDTDVLDGPSPGRRLSAAVLTADGAVWAETLDRGAKLMRPGRAPEIVLDAHVLEELVLSPDGMRLHGLSNEGALVTHDVGTGAERRAQGTCKGSKLAPMLSRRVWSSRDGSRVAAGLHGGALCIWDAATGDALVHREAEKGQWTIGPDFRWAVHDPENGRDPTRRIDLEDGTTTDLPEEARVLAVTGEGLVIYQHEGLAWACDPSSGERWALASAGGTFYMRAAVSPDDREVVLYGHRGGLRFFSLERPVGGPEAAAALTEIVTRQQAKSR